MILALIALSLSAFAKSPKYVFYMIGDGMGINHAYAAEKYNLATGGEEINFFHFPVRTFVNTYSANSYVTDSAAGGTALSTGTKVNNSAIAMSVDGEPLVSLAERAKKAGYATGIVSSTSITDATPAAFYAKAPRRHMSDTISAQLIAADVDFAAGSGFQKERGSDKDTEYWAAEARKAGITVFYGKQEYKPCKGRVLMLPAEGSHGVPVALDRREGDTRLADFTAAAIEHLYAKSPKGFFLMVEGAKIDYGAHSDDAATVIHEVNDFSESVGLVLDFCSKHPNECLVVVVADHETGGFTMGDDHYTQRPELLASQKISKDGLTAELMELQKRGSDVSWTEVKDLLRSELGLWDSVEVSDRESRTLTMLYKEAFLDGDTSTEKNLKSANTRLAVEAVDYLDYQAGFRFITSAHSGAPLGLYVTGVKATDFLGCTENTDVPKTIARIAGYK